MWCCPGGKGFLPSVGAKTPPVTGLEAWKLKLGHRGHQIIAAGFGKLEELSRDDRANGVTAEVLWPGRATAVTIKSGNGVCATGYQFLAEYVEVGGFMDIVV